MIVAQLTDDGKNFVWLIPVLLNGRPWKFIRRIDASVNRIELRTDDRPVIMLNGLPWQPTAEQQVTQ